MALFSRREIQQRLAEAARFATREQLSALINRLNKSNETALEAEWELMWLTSLARVGSVRHEPRFPNGTRFPDVHFKNTSIEFVADVAAVFDLGYEEENPIDTLRDELNKLYAKFAPGGGFTLSVQYKMEGAVRDQRVKLAIPARHEIPAFVRKNFEGFLRAVAKDPSKAARHQAAVVDLGVIQLDYNPTRRPYNSSGGHASFDVPYSLNRNPIFNTLKRKKQQLAGTGFAGAKGIILCDGDCSAITSRMYSASAYTLDNIVWDFLRQNTSVSFVLTVGVSSRHFSFGAPSELSLEPKFFGQRSSAPDLGGKLVDIANAALGHFPKLHRTPANARHHLRAGSPPGLRRSDYYCWSSVTLGGPMQQSEIKISARTLTALLAGEIDLKEFREAHRLSSNNGGPPVEPLRMMVQEGRRLESVEIEAMPGEDDDLVVLRFGSIDPAAANFQMPDKT